MDCYKLDILFNDRFTLGKANDLIGDLFHSDF